MEATNDARKEGRSVRKIIVHPGLDTKRHGQTHKWCSVPGTLAQEDLNVLSVSACCSDTFRFPSYAWYAIGGPNQPGGSEKVWWVKAQERQHRILQRMGRSPCGREDQRPAGECGQCRWGSIKSMVTRWPRGEREKKRTVRRRGI